MSDDPGHISKAQWSAIEEQQPALAGEPCGFSSREAALESSLRIAVDSDLGRLWLYPDTARETWLVRARAALAQQASQAPAEGDDLAEALAAELFDLGSEGPDHKCGRIQFMLGGVNERPGGGLGREAFKRFAARVIATNVQPKSTEPPNMPDSFFAGMDEGYRREAWRIRQGVKQSLQATSPVDEEPTAFVHWPLNGPPRLVWYSTKAMVAAMKRGDKAQNGYVPDMKLYSHTQAPAVTPEKVRADALEEAAKALEPLKARWLPNVRDIYVVGECVATIRALVQRPPAHPKQIAGVGCALCGRNEAGYYCTGDCGEYQEAASHPPVQGTGGGND